MTQKEMEKEFKNVNDKLDAILKQAKETNGRVTNLEKWREMLRGVWLAIGIISVVGAFICGMVFTVLNYAKNDKHTTNQTYSAPSKR